ncbi:MAG: DNA circularization N-terminal domain-containing protein, partial [Chromatiales bacterium]
MSWHDNFTAKGSFRGAAFVMRTDDLEFGRRLQVHEYPLRDKPYAEDLGRKARRFTIEVFVAGPDYLADRDDLIAAIEKPGQGPLVHPYFGTLQVSIVSARKRESTRSGGMASFTLTCIEASDLPLPTAQRNTKPYVEKGAWPVIDKRVVMLRMQNGT